MLSKRAGMTVLVLFLTAAIAAYMGTSLLMPTSAQPQPPPTVPERPTGISISQDENGVILQWDDPGDKSVTRYRIVRTMIQDGRPVLTSITDWRDRGKQFYTDSRALPSRTYTYQIWAKNAVGESQGSDVITVRTPADTQGTTAPPGSSTVREPRSDTPGHLACILYLQRQPVSEFSGTPPPTRAPPRSPATISGTKRPTPPLGTPPSRAYPE